MFSKVDVGVSPFFNYSKAYHPPKGSVQHFFIVRFIIIPKASPLLHFCWEIFGGNKQADPTFAENSPTDWPKVLCFGSSSKPTAFSASSRTFDVDRGAFGGIPSWECWRNGFLSCFYLRKTGVKVRMFGVVFSTYIQISTDYNFHSSNQHFAIYSHKLNSMWMIFLWGKFHMKQFNSLLLFCWTSTLPECWDRFLQRMQVSKEFGNFAHNAGGHKFCKRVEWVLLWCCVDVSCVFLVKTDLIRFVCFCLRVLCLWVGLFCFFWVVYDCVYFGST